MQTISLTPFDLALAAVLVMMLAVTSWRLQLGVARQLVVAALRTTVQLSLIGVVLKVLFADVHPAWLALAAVFMLVVAAFEVRARQSKRFRGWWSFGVGAVSMFVSSFAITVLALVAVVQPTPWHDPRYAIPLLGMMTGNTLTGIALALHHLTHQARAQRGSIEAQLMLGIAPREAITPMRREAMRSGLMPTVNSMATAGLVSLPGMMTGQILAGNPPTEAVKYQILVMFLIASGTGFGVLTAVTLASRRLFDERERVRLDRLQSGRDAAGRGPD